METQNYIVGTSECPFTAIVRSIEHSKSISEILGKWKSIASSLGVSDETTLKLDNGLQKNTITIYEAVEIMLQDWKRNNPNHAYLETFLEILKTHDIHDFANSLSVRFPQKQLESRSHLEVAEMNPSCENRSENLPSQVILPLVSSCLENSAPSKWFQIHSPHLILLYTLLLVLVVVIIFLGYSVLSLTHVAHSEGRKTYEKLKNVISETEGHNDTKPPFNGSSKSPSKLSQLCDIIVTLKYEELFEFPITLPAQAEICLTVSFANTNYDDSAILSRVTEVNITGTVNIKGALHILQKFPMIQTLLIINNPNSNICSKIKEKQDSFSQSMAKIRLGELKSIHIENFRNCPEFLNALFQNLFMRNLQNIEITNTIVKASNLKFIQEILKTARYSLQSLTITGTKFEVPLFQDFPYILDKMTHVQLESPIKSEFLLSCLGESFPIVVPNLKRYIFRNSYMQWEDFIRLLQLKSIETLEIWLEVPDSQKFLCTRIIENFKLLQMVNLILRLEDIQTCTSVCSNRVKNLFDITTHVDSCEIGYKSNKGGKYII